MLLVKSLIIIFLLLLIARFHKTVKNFILNLFDIREGFGSKLNFYELGSDEAASEAERASEAVSSASASEAGASETEEYEELQYKVYSKEKKFNSDTSMISDLQEKMNELMKIKEKSDIINQTILKS